MWKRSDGKHAPNTLHDYIDLHHRTLIHYEETGFIVDNGISISYDVDAIRIEGRLRCRGGITVDVRKQASFITDGDDPVVRNSGYSYNVAVQGRVLVRYDSPHGHRPVHHVHRYDIWDDEPEEQIEPLQEDDDCPVMGDVIREAADFYYEHAPKLEGF